MTSVGDGVPIPTWVARDAEVASIPSGLATPASGRERNRKTTVHTVDGLPVGQGECVLVVDDEEGIRQIVTEALDGLGYRVLAAGTVAEALEVLAVTTGIDLVFTDIVMPGGRDGIDLAREVRRRWPTMPVLFTSGYAGRGAGTPAWPRDLPLLQKPYRIDALAQAVRSCIDAGAQRPS